MPTSLSRTLSIPLVAGSVLLLFWLGLTQSILVVQPVLAKELTTTQQTNLWAQPQALAGVMNSQLFTSSIIVLTTTVGRDPGLCATVDSIIVSAGSPVYYCYAIHNASNYTLTHQTIAGSAYGYISKDAPFTLTPGLEGLLIVTATVQRTTPNTTTWTTTATNGVTLQAVDTTVVVVPEISLSVTVGIDPHLCSATSTADASVGTEMTYCYRAWNRGQVPFSYHQVRASQLALPVGAEGLWDKPLAPGESIFVTVTHAVTQSTTTVVTWTAFLTESIAATATNVARVRVPTLVLSTTVAPGRVLCTDTMVTRVSVITVTNGSLVTFCYWATNTGGVPLVHHVVADKVVQRPSTAFTLTIDTQESVVVSATRRLTQTLVNSVTWQATDDNGLWATASNTATVHVVPATWVEAFVFYDVNGNGLPDKGEPGLPNVAIELAPVVNRSVNATTALTESTDSDGLASFVDLTPGAYIAAAAPLIIHDGDPYTLTAQSTKIAVTVNRGEKQPVLFGYVASRQQDTDDDGVSDWIEGIEDHNGEGKPDFADGIPGGRRLFLPVLTR